MSVPFPSLSYSSAIEYWQQNLGIVGNFTSWAGQVNATSITVINGSGATVDGSGNVVCNATFLESGTLPAAAVTRPWAIVIGMSTSASILNGSVDLQLQVAGTETIHINRGVNTDLFIADSGGGAGFNEYNAYPNPTVITSNIFVSSDADSIWRLYQNGILLTPSAAGISAMEDIAASSKVDLNFTSTGSYTGPAATTRTYSGIAIIKITATGAGVTNFIATDLPLLSNWATQTAAGFTPAFKSGNLRYMGYW